MYLKCCSEKAAMQQQKFEEAMLTMMLQLPYDSISISALCRQADLSRKVFYRLFDTKLDVLHALVDHRLIDESSYQPPEAGGLHRFFGYWLSQKPLLDALSANNISTLLTQRAIIYAMKEGPECQYMFGIQAEKNSWETMIFYLSGLFALVLDWHAQGYTRSIGELCDLVMHLLTTPPIKNPWLLDR